MHRRPPRLRQLAIVPAALIVAAGVAAVVLADGSPPTPGPPAGGLGFAPPALPSGGDAPTPPSAGTVRSARVVSL